MTSPKEPKIEGPVAVYDFDNYYMGSALAEHLARSGLEVRYVTPAGHASAWAIMSNEQPQIHRTLFAAGVALHTLARVVGFEGGELTLANQFTNAASRFPCQIPRHRRHAFRQRFSARRAHGARRGFKACRYCLGHARG